MKDMDRNLGRRLRTISLCLVALGGALSAGRPAVAEDLGSLRQQAQAAADEITGLEHELVSLEDRKAALDARIAEAGRSLGVIELRMHEAEVAMQEAEDRYVARAVETYKTGPTTNLSLILSAQSLPEAYAVAEIMSNASEKDAEALEKLMVARSRAGSAQQRIDARKQKLLRVRAQAEEVGAEIGATLGARRAALSRLAGRIDHLERLARAAAEAAAAEAAARAEEARSAPPPSQELLELLAPAGPTPGIPKGFAPTGVSFEGTASWYGPGFEGNLTASGDVFDSRLFTAASKELPLGSFLYVEHEGRGVVVLVNDRGPYVGDRILDLSRAAAEAIGISGLGWVEAQILIKL